MGKSASSCIAILLLITVTPFLADFDAGLRAYQKGVYSVALKEWIPLAERGNSHAQNNLGIMYQEGLGVTRDEKEAAKWYRKAGDQGLPQAQISLGSMYMVGKGVRKSQREGVSWFRKSAEQGHPNGQFALGLCCYEGKGVEKNRSEAAKWYRLAAEQGYGSAQYALGRAYHFGEGVSVNHVQAYVWYDLALKNNVADASTPRLEAWFSMSQEQKGRAVDLIKTIESNRRANPPVVSHRGAEERRIPSEPPLLPRDNFQKQEPQIQSSGSGFIITKEGQVLTNSHVINGCTSIVARNDLGTQRLKLIAEDTVNDLALLGNFQPVRSLLAFSDNTHLKLGQDAIVVGFPLQRLLASSMSLTTGSISALAGVGDDTRMIQISAPIQVGNSGGPVIDQSGNVIGVITSKLNALKAARLSGDFPQNVNFAIKGYLARTFLDSNRVDYLTSESSVFVATTEIGARAQESVVAVECWK